MKNLICGKRFCVGNPWEMKFCKFSKPLYLRAKSANLNQIFVTRLVTAEVLRDFLRDTSSKIRKMGVGCFRPPFCINHIIIISEFFAFFRRGDPVWSPVSLEFGIRNSEFGIMDGNFVSFDLLKLVGACLEPCFTGRGISKFFAFFVGATHRNLHICAKPQIHDSSSKSSQFRIPNSEFRIQKSRPSPLHVSDFLHQMP